MFPKSKKIQWNTTTQWRTHKKYTNKYLIVHILFSGQIALKSINNKTRNKLHTERLAHSTKDKFSTIQY